MSLLNTTSDHSADKVTGKMNSDDKVSHRLMYVPVRLWGMINATNDLDDQLWFGYEDFRYYPLKRTLVHVASDFPLEHRRTRFPFVCFVYFGDYGLVSVLNQFFMKHYDSYHSEFYDDWNQDNLLYKSFDIDLKVFYTEYSFQGCAQFDKMVAMLYPDNKLVMVNIENFRKPFFLTSYKMFQGYKQVY